MCETFLLPGLPRRLFSSGVRFLGLPAGISGTCQLIPTHPKITQFCGRSQTGPRGGFQRKRLKIKPRPPMSRNGFGHSLFGRCKPLHCNAFELSRLACIADLRAIPCHHRMYPGSEPAPCPSVALSSHRLALQGA